MCLLLAEGQAFARFSAFQQFRQDCAPHCSRQNLFDQGNTASETAGNAEASRARDLESHSQTNRQFADQVENDRQALNRKLASTTTTEREQILSKRYEPPEMHRELAKATGLTTNASLLRKGEEVSLAARDYATKQSAAAQKMQKRAAEGLAAAAKLENMSRTFEERNMRMQSVGKGRAKASNGKGAPEIGSGTGASTEHAKGISGRGTGATGWNEGAVNSSLPSSARTGPAGGNQESDSLVSFQNKLTFDGKDDRPSDLKASNTPGAYKDLLAKDLGLDKPKTDPASVLQTSADLDAHLDQVLRSRSGRSLASIDENTSNVSRSGPDVSLFKRVHSRLELHQERGNLILQDN